MIDSLSHASSAMRLLVVDDDRRQASHLAQWLCGLGHHASAAGTAAEAVQALARAACDVIILDGAMADAQRVAAAARGAGLLVLLPAAEAPAVVGDAAVASPVRDADLLAAIDQARSAAADRAAGASVAPAVLGSHPALRRVLEVVGRIATTPATVLVTGESGTGKSLLAREIHRASGRTGRFVEVACGALSETLLESELFGHVAGAFTGATADREGRFLQAHGGTIFLDEIATATPAMQVKLLRVLQDMAFEPVGGSRTHAVDARVILATHESLEQLVADGRFRADLYWRINVVTVEMPPLRSRSSDIPFLAAHFLAAAAAKAGRRVEGFTPAALEALVSHGWPGNVRELEHAVARAAFLGRESLVDVCDLPPAVIGRGPVAAGDGGQRGAPPLKAAMAVPERQLILEALERSNWRRDAAARALGINRTTLYKKAKRLGMNLADLAPDR
ncbi:MAG: sigma 54-interacting transcriptional regulator [Planctomycetaceae bacterium]|nr:sigma 54-interacting transcriptional regulator [Planctomycetaceae bacterium]